MSTNQIIVKPFANKWLIEDSDGVSITRSTKQRARDYAFTMKHLYGYEVVIHNEDGSIDLDPI